MDGLEPERDLIFDIGMHIGDDSAYYLRKGYRVVGFEADEALVEHCERRFHSAIEEGRLTIIRGAIANTNESTVTFYTNPTKSDWGTVEAQWADRNAKAGAASIPVEVPVTDFDSSLRTFGVPWFMKVDIEGADRLCLEALRNHRARPAFVSIESEKVDWSRLLGEFSLLEELGFDRFAAVQQWGISGQEVQTRTLIDEQLIYRFEEFSSGAFGDDILWSSRDKVLAQYRKIFRQYRLIGDDGVFCRNRVGKKALKVFSGLTGLQFAPSWYDTHAARSAALQCRSSEEVPECLYQH
jgi:FkbM family methyltransferase